jgi:hypothetical protein
MREVVDGVIEIPIGYVKAYAVVTDDGVVLVDTGLPGRADKVVRAIVEARRQVGQVHTILLTPLAPRPRRRRCRAAPPLRSPDRRPCRRRIADLRCKTWCKEPLPPSRSGRPARAGAGSRG